MTVLALVAALVGAFTAPAAAAPAPAQAQGTLASLLSADRAGGKASVAALESYVVTIRNFQTGLCLDSNYAGHVYTLGCNGGNYQRWRLEFNGSILTAHNMQTGLCLDHNGRDSVYTLGCNGGSYQLWFGTGGHVLHNFYSRCLDSNYAGHVYAIGCNGGNYQNWHFTLA